MNINKALKRDRKINRRRNGHREDGRSVFTIKEIEKQRALRKKKEMEDKLARLEDDDS